MSGTAVTYHKTLAKYFDKKPLYLDGESMKKPNVRRLMEQPWQQTRGEMWDEVTDTLCDLEFIQAKAVAKLLYEAVNEIDIALEVISDDVVEVNRNENRQVLMENYMQELIACSKREFNVNRLNVIDSVLPWDKERSKTEIERIRLHPNRADKLKDFRSFLGQEVSQLHEFAGRFSNFTLQQAWNFADDGPVSAAAQKLKQYFNSKLLIHNQISRPLWNPLSPVLQILRAHEDVVTDVDLTPDGSFALSGSRDKTCILWDIKTGQPIKTLFGHTSTINAVCISSDKKRGISGADDKMCILWELETGKVIKMLEGHTASVNAVTISPDGRYAVSGASDNTCIFWDLDKGEPINVLHGHTSAVNSVSMTPDARYAFSGSSDNTCIFWDLHSSRVLGIFKEHYRRVNSVFICIDGKIGISGSEDTNCILWDLDKKDVMSTLRNWGKAPVYSVSFTPDKKYAFAGYGNYSCILFDLENGLPLKTFKKHSKYVTSVAISHDSRIAISGSADHTCIVWDLVKSNAFDHEVKRSRRVIKSISFSNDGKNAFIGSSYGYCYVLGLDKSTYKILEKHFDSVWSVITCPDGKHGISGSHDKTFILWDLESGEPKKTIKVNGAVNSIVISPEGKRIVIQYFSSDTIIDVWCIDSSEKLTSFRGNLSEFQNFGIAMSQDGKWTISFVDDKYVLWSLKTGNALKSFTGIASRREAITISPNGKFAITGHSDGICVLWDLREGCQVKKFCVSADDIISVAFTPDGERFVLASNDNRSILWDLKTNEMISIFINSDTIQKVDVILGNIFGASKEGKPFVLSGGNDPLFTGNCVSTIRRIWNYETKILNPPSADCPLCGHRFSPSRQVVETIEEITRNAGLTPEQSPCLELPDEAWEDPGLLSECPKCKEKLKFNPFIAGGD